MTASSLLVGSDALGWQEFGDVAQLGSMTRAIPGGDGSLEFTVPGIEAGKRRNVLRKDAEVILDTGDDQWAGLIVGDPMAGYYAAQPLVSVAAGGLWAHCANRRDVAWVWVDSDPTQWFRIRQYFDDVSGEMVDYIDQGKFAIDTEGRLMIRADSDRVFKEGSYATLGYWLGQGIADSGNRIVGVDISYKSQMPGPWMAEVKSYLGSPWGAVDDLGNVEWADGTTRAPWRSQDIDLEAPSRSLLVSVDDFAGTGSPEIDPFVTVHTVVVRCRMDGPTPFSATGGTVTTDGDYTVHKFTAADTLECTGTIDAKVLRIGAGGGGSSGGGGAGGVIPEEDVVLTGTMPVTIGEAGIGGAVASVDGSNGGDTIFAGKTAKGGAGAGRAGFKGNDGASGSGAGLSQWAILSGGAATPAGQGNVGGSNGTQNANYPAGGGGGAGGPGSDGSDPSTGGPGGPGVNSDIVQRGTPVGYAGGGGAGVGNTGTPGTATHGGGPGTDQYAANGSDGTANTGAGGGGCRADAHGGNGAKGILVVRYLTPAAPSVDRDVTLDKAMCDLATLPGLATVTRSETLGAARDQLAIRPEFEKSVADGLRELAGLHNVPVEHYFDRAAGAWRFTCNELPAVVDPTRNRHWILDDKRPGEDSSGVVRDLESAPEYLRVTYLASGVADIPNGQPRSYCYPSEPENFVANVGVFTDQADVKLTDAQAADVAARLHEQMSVAAFSGSAVLPQTALTVTGQELPSRLARPGDRVNIMGREGATDLYVSETSYDWSSGKMSVTVGWPFDVLTAPRKPTSWAPWPVRP